MEWQKHQVGWSISKKSMSVILNDTRYQTNRIEIKNGINEMIKFSKEMETIYTKSEVHFRAWISYRVTYLALHANLSNFSKAIVSLHYFRFIFRFSIALIFGKMFSQMFWQKLDSNTNNSLEQILKTK